MSILNKIISNIITNDTDCTQNNVPVNKYLNNLNDCDDRTGIFNIKIFGVGGAGCNVVNTIYNAKKWSDNIQMFALNTDIKTLRRMSNVPVYLMGKKILRGGGSGGDPQVARAIVQEDKNAIKDILKDTDLLFLIAGLGKGTGSGSTPEIAKIAKELGILTVAIVNFPSINSEGSSIYKNALDHFEILRKNVDSITYISNDRIIKNNRENLSFIKAFEKANLEVTSIIDEVTYLITSASEMNIDYSDIKNFFKQHKNFFANTVIVKDDYSKETLKQCLFKSLFESNSDINTDIDNISVLANFTISPKTPSTIVADVRNAFKELIKNHNLTMTLGMDYQGVDNIKITYFMSSGELHSDIKESVISESELPDVRTNLQSLNNIFQKQKRTDSKEYQPIHEDTSIGIERQSIIDNEYEFAEEDLQQTLDSKKAIELITKAMNNITITNQSSDEKQNKNN
jgi:cell division protein FtsZ